MTQPETITMAEQKEAAAMAIAREAGAVWPQDADRYRRYAAAALATARAEAEALRQALETAEQMFGPVIAAAVDALTRREGESYMEFIDRACTNEIAIAVKLADIRDNLDLSRLGRKPTPADKRRSGKYIAAKSRILARLAAQDATRGRYNNDSQVSGIKV